MLRIDSNKSNVKCYIVTIKGHELRHYEKTELDTRLDNLVKKMKSVEWSSMRAYEEDSMQRMHVHTYCITTRTPYYKRYQEQGWSIHFKQFPLEDVKNVRNYFRKVDQDKKVVEQRFLENEVSNWSYAFT